MKLRSSLSAGRIALVASLLTLATSPLAAEWKLALKGGITPFTGGDVHQGPSFDGSVLLGLPANSLPVAVDAKSFDDVYGNFTEIGLEAAFVASPNLEYVFGLNQLTAGEGRLRVGTVAGSLPLEGRFSRYEDLHLYGGIRYNFQVSERLNPYVMAQIGIKRVDAITASFSVPNTPFNEPYRSALTSAAFYDRCDVLTYGVLVGVEYALSEKASIALETGYIAQGQLADNDTVLGLLGLNALNDEGELSYVPVRLSARFRF